MVMWNFIPYQETVITACSVINSYLHIEILSIQIEFILLEYLY